MRTPTELNALTDALNFYTDNSPNAGTAMIGAEELTFRELDDNSSKVAAGLAHMGIGPGDRIAYLGDYSTSYWEALFACAKLGAVLVPLGKGTHNEDVDYALEECHADLIIRNSQHVILNSQGIEELALTPQQWEEWKTQYPPLMEYCFVEPDTPIVEEFCFADAGFVETKLYTHHDWLERWRA